VAEPLRSARWNRSWDRNPAPGQRLPPRLQIPSARFPDPPVASPPGTGAASTCARCAQNRRSKALARLHPGGVARCSARSPSVLRILFLSNEVQTLLQPLVAPLRLPSRHELTQTPAMTCKAILPILFVAAFNNAASWQTPPAMLKIGLQSLVY